MMKNPPLSTFSKLHIYRKIRKQPKLLKEIFSILGHYSNEFLRERSAKYLYKLTQVYSCTLEHFPKTFSDTGKRDLYMKCLAVEFQHISYPRKVLGVTLSFRLLIQDYNKNHLSKQNQDISSFEELFFSLLPSNIQLLISSKIALELYKSFHAIKDIPLKNHLALQTFQSNDVVFILLKTASTSYDFIFSNLPSRHLVAHGKKVIDQTIYHCLIQINPFDISLVELIEERLRKIQTAPIKNTLHIHFQEGSPPSCHPHLSADIKTLTFCKALFEGLTRINPKENIELALARSIDISPCKKQYTFTIRSSKWSNGEEITSYHFANSWKKAISHGSNCIGVRNFFLIKNAKKAHLKEIPIDEVGIYTPSKDLIVIELEYPAPYFLELLADPLFSPLYSTEDEEPTVFNGPFLLSFHRINERIELISNPMYWDSKEVKLRKIHIFLIQDSQKAYEMYENKDLDWIGSPFNSISFKTFQGSKAVQSYEGATPFWLFCNTNNPKLASANIRRALSYAIDREKLIQEILPFQTPSYSIIPEKLSSLNIKEHFPKNRIGRALLSFEEGLQEIGYKRKDFQLTLNHSDIPEQKKLAYFLKTTWEKVFNIQIHLVEKPWNAYWNTFLNQEYEIGGFSILTTYQSPFYFMDFFESSDNRTKWEHKEYQKYLNLAKQSVDENEKSSFLKKAEMILNNEMPVIALYQQHRKTLSFRTEI